MKVKQVIVMRKDLNMRKGKMIAQGAHASMMVLLNEITFRKMRGPLFNIIDISYTHGEMFLLGNNPMLAWLDEKFTKVCVSVDSEAELDAIYKAAQDANLKCAMVTDAGLTEFNGVPTKTCCAIGPNWDVDIDPITGHLKLL